MAAETVGASQLGAKSSSAAAPVAAAAVAPVPAPSSRYPTTSTVSLKSPTREEGELSSDADAESPTWLAVPPDGKAPVKPFPLSSKRNPDRSFKTGKMSSMSKVHPQMLKRKIYSKTFRQKQMPLTAGKSRSLSWQKKGSNDNLVIKFSDDDSGSESGRSEPETSIDSREAGVKSNKPMAYLQTQSNISGQPTHPGTKQVLRKGVSAANSYRANLYSLESFSVKDPQVQRKTSVKPLVSQVQQGHILDPRLVDTAVESLRHQIALRENELNGPRKTMEQKNETVLGSYNRCHEQLSHKTGSQAYDISSSAFSKTADKTTEHRLIEGSRLAEKLGCNQFSVGITKRHAFPKNYSSISHNSEMRSSFIKENGEIDILRLEKVNSQDKLDRVSRKRHLEADGNPLVASKVNPKSQDKETYVATTVSPSIDELGKDPKKAKKSKTATDVSSSYLNYNKEIIPIPEIHKSTANSDDDFCDLSEKIPAIQVAKFSSELALENSIGKSSHNVLENKRGSVVGILGQRSKNLESLLHLEELQDKELEEAQEVRRRCELEERHALRAYRRAQRALLDANERCAILYRKRELISAELQTSLLESSSSLCPSSWQDGEEYMLETLKSFPNASFNSLPILSSHLPAKDQILEHLEHRLDSQCSGGEQNDASSRMMNLHDPRFNQLAEPDGNTSNHRYNLAKLGLGASMHEKISANDDEDHLAIDNRSFRSEKELPVQSGNFEERTVVDSQDRKSQDYDLLEASLRSKLVERFGMRTLSKSSEVEDGKAQSDKVTNDENHNTCSLLDHQSKEERPCTPTSRGVEEAGGSATLVTGELCGYSQENELSINLEPLKDHEPRGFLKKSCSSNCDVASYLPSSKLHHLSRHMIFVNPLCHSKEDRQTNDVCDKVLMRENMDHIQGCLTSNLVSCEMGYRNSDSSIDPFWPFCMFELRGKCNDEECPWQHTKSSFRRKLKQTNSSASSFSGLHNHSLPIPSYFVGSAHINIDSCFFQSVLVRSTWLYWQTEFSASFAYPLFIRRVLPLDAPLLQSDDGPVIEHDGWNRHSYFGSHDRRMNKIVQGLPDCEQSLELALDLYSGKFHKPEREKALDDLARAIEANTDSVLLWAAYLHMYYRNETSIGKDDMFFHAVQYNQYSFELWLMFINSRMHLDERFNAYNDSLSSMCHANMTCDQDLKHRSAFVLDIFMQMIDFLIMSGSIEKAIDIIKRLAAEAGSEFPGDKLLLDIISCLTAPDKCIFWICCVHLATYEKLPDALVLQFELEKDLPFEVEWPLVQLTPDRKNLAVMLMKLSVENVALDIYKEDRVSCRSFHCLAICHIRFMEAVDGLGSSDELLVHYVSMYPTCIELALMLARKQESGRAFEEIIHNWPKDAPGIHCLWNQYVEHALAKDISSAKKVMELWFQEFGEVKHSEGTEEKSDGFIDTTDAQVSDGECRNISHTGSDDMFRLLNFSIYRQLQNDYTEAHIAVDQALALANRENYKHCLKEHSVLLLSGLEFSEGSSFERILQLINIYFGDSRFLPQMEPFSRKIYQRVERPRLRKLIDDFLGLVTADFSLLNTVLEVSHGPSLIPKKDMNLKDLVNFVESIMDVAPGNYLLAVAVFEFVAKNFGCNTADSYGVLLWAASVLINSIFQALPVAPESIWVRVINLLEILGIKEILVSFHKLAIMLYPFSLKLWKSYLALSKTCGNADAIMKAARERGLEL